MSAIDRGSGFPDEGPEDTGAPQDGGREHTAADATSAWEAAPADAARAAESEAAEAERTTSFSQSASYPAPEPPDERIERSAIPRRPARGLGSFPAGREPQRTNPAEQPGSPHRQQPREHQAGNPLPPRPPTGAASPQSRSEPSGPSGPTGSAESTGSFTAYGGGFGASSGPPHGADSQPAPDHSSGRRDGRGKVVLVAAVTALVTSLVVGPTAAVVTDQLLSDDAAVVNPQNGSNVSSAPQGSVSAVASTTLPSVVSISTPGSNGSGFIISADGLIVTNNHVVAGADTLAVRFNSGADATATVVGTDPVSDLALVQAEDVSGLSPAALGNSDKVNVGEGVVAIGSPLGLSGTVTSGVISSLERPVNTGPSEQPPPQQPQDGFPGLPDQGPQENQSAPQVSTSTVIDAIQTDAPINPGNSGGPLMNMSGEVIGINTAIATTSSGIGGSSQSGSIGLGFAIPINQAKPIIEELAATGEASYAAIEATITMPDSGGQGAEIVEVARNGAADQAGLRAGDIITKVGDRAVTDPNVLIAAVRSHRPDDTVTVTYQRGNSTAETQVTLAGQSASSIGE